MNFRVVKSNYDNESEKGWHWKFYLYEDCEGYDWGGEAWIRSKESQKYIREYETQEKGSGLVS